MGGKSSTERERFFTPCLQIDKARFSTNRTLSDFEIFFHQITANLPWNATKIVRCLKTYDLWGLF